MTDHAAHAAAAWDTLRRSCLRLGGDGAVVVLEGPGGRMAPLWPASQVLAAAVDLAALTGDLTDTLALVRGLEAYRSGEAYAPTPGARRRYFDDNAWVGLALLQLHLFTGEDEHLEAARRIFRFLQGGRGRTGGVRWVEGNSSVNTCASAPAAELAVRLFMLDGDPGALTFAEDAMRWIDRKMRLPTGLIADHEHRGKIDRTVWSYNQGSTLGANALLYRANGSDVELEDARRTAFSSLGHFSGEALWAHPPVFNAVWFRNLMALDALAPVPGFDQAFDAYLERVLAAARDPATGLFTAGGIGSYDGTATIDHAGLVQLLALGAWPRERRPDIC